MTTTSLYRFSGACLVLSFLTSLAGGVLHPVVDGQSHSVEAFLASRSPYAQYLIYLGALLLMLGLPGGYLWLRDRIGVLGFVGFVGYAVGNALSAMSHLVVEAFVGPTLAGDPRARHLVPDSGEIFDASSFVTLQAVGGLVFVASLLLVGVALVRADGVPTWIGVVLLVGGLLLLVPLPEPPGLTGLQVELARGLAMAAIGVLAIRGRKQTARTATQSAEARSHSLTT